jgi:hypothetical protein
MKIGCLSNRYAEFFRGGHLSKTTSTMNVERFAGYQYRSLEWKVAWEKESGSLKLKGQWNRT